MKRFILGLSVALLVAGCEEIDETPRWLLTDSRVLAVRAEPPVLAPETTASLNALVVNGDGSISSAEVSWRACDPWQLFVDPTGSCAPNLALPLPDGVLDPQRVLERFPPPQPLPPIGNLPWDPNATVGDECSDVPDIELPVVAEVTVDGRRLYGIKRVPVTPVDTARTNPRIGAVALDDEVPGGLYTPDTTFSLSVEPDRSAQDLRCDDGYLEPESLRVHLYTTAGTLRTSNIDIRYDSDGNESAELSSWTSPTSGAATLWLIAIDRDGGADWRAYNLETSAP